MTFCCSKQLNRTFLLSTLTQPIDCELQCQFARLNFLNNDYNKPLMYLTDSVPEVRLVLSDIVYGVVVSRSSTSLVAVDIVTNANTNVKGKQQ